MPHRYSSHWQWYLWESQVCAHSPNSPRPRECLESDQLLFPSHSAPLLKHEGNSHPRPPLLTLLPLPLAPHTEMWEREQIKWKQWEMGFLPPALHCHLSPVTAPAQSQARASCPRTGRHLPQPLISAHFSTSQHPRARETKDESHSSYIILWIPRAVLPSEYSTFSKGITGLNLPNLWPQMSLKIKSALAATITGQEKRSNIHNQ